MPIENIIAKSESMKKRKKAMEKVMKRLAFDENMEKTNWKKYRRFYNLVNSIVPKEKGVTFGKIENLNLKGIIATAENADEKNVIVYIHGGGFVAGTPRHSKAFLSLLAKESNNVVIGVDYSLAPEHPFPQGLDDCDRALNEIFNLYKDSTITLVGDSAGGNFCLVLGLKYKEKISCIMLHSPMTDFTDSLDRSENPINDIIVKDGCLNPLLNMYVKENNPADPSISPIYGDFNNLPPIYITCDRNETLYADSKAVYDKCLENNVDVKMVIIDGTYHAVGAIGAGTDETKNITIDAIKFMRKYI